MLLVQKHEVKSHYMYKCTCQMTLELTFCLGATLANTLVLGRSNCIIFGLDWRNVSA